MAVSERVRWTLEQAMVEAGLKEAGERPGARAGGEAAGIPTGSLIDHRSETPKNRPKSILSSFADLTEKQLDIAGRLPYNIEVVQRRHVFLCV